MQDLRKPKLLSVLNENIIVLKLQNIHVIENLKYTPIYSKNLAQQLTLHSAEVYSELIQTFRQGGCFVGGN